MCILQWAKCRECPMSKVPADGPLDVWVHRQAQVCGAHISYQGDEQASQTGWRKTEAGITVSTSQDKLAANSCSPTMCCKMLDLFFERHMIALIP